MKYMITPGQKERILQAMEPYMTPDRYARSTVRNIYFDTDDFVLARHSIAKPDFKEKLRIRSYTKVDADSTVFVELKRKFDGVVYKRRVGMAEADAMEWMEGKQHPDEQHAHASVNRTQTGSIQMKSEIDYFRSLYNGLKPALYLSYEREAYRMKEGMDINSGGSEFRVTFDSNILCREYDLSLTSEPGGISILEDGMILMEIKCLGGMPVWMAEVLSEERIYKTSFSKYGTAYCRFMRETPAERAKAIAAESIAASGAERRINQTENNRGARRIGWRRRPGRPVLSCEASA